MNIYSLRTKWKFFLLACAIAIGVGSLWYTNALVGKLEDGERKKIELWAETYRLLSEANGDDSNLDFYLQVMENNTTIPVIIVDKDQKKIMDRNIDSVKMSDPKYVSRRLEKMKNKYDPIILDLYDGDEQYLYYDDSIILKQLFYYPFIQFAIIILFVAIIQV